MKSYNTLDNYYETLKDFKEKVKDLKDWELKSIYVIEEEEFIKEKVRIAFFVNNKKYNVFYDIFTQYKIWYSEEWLIVKLDSNKIIEDAKKIIREVLENE